MNMFGSLIVIAVLIVAANLLRILADLYLDRQWQKLERMKRRNEHLLLLCDSLKFFRKKRDDEIELCIQAKEDGNLTKRMVHFKRACILHSKYMREIERSKEGDEE